MRKRISIGLGLLFVFTLVCSFTATFTAQTVVAGPDPCCIHHVCIDPPGIDAIGEVVDFGGGRKGCMYLPSNPTCIAANQCNDDPGQ